jgi:signal transduction histidine kinase
MIVSDKQMIQQVVLNLVSNALKFTEQGEVFVDLRIDTSYHNETGKKEN